ncbi:MAG TPA: hypothetical protein VFD92_22930 [Candidatus Binatia bacterium]|nr:hypothetical protein [Candidatus Binatia bacterium]
MTSHLSGMKPRGYYDAHSSLQSESFDWASRWLIDAIPSMELPRDQRAISVADFGSSTGANSIRGAGVIVAALRRVRPTEHVEVTHNDLPSNDFNSLCAALWSPSAENYLQSRGVRRPSVSVRLAPGSFYAPLLPPASLHVGTSLMALEWLSAPIAASAPDEIFCVDAPGDVLERYREQCRNDLALFLRHRANETVSGGLLLIVYPGRTSTDYTLSGGYRALNDALKAQVDAGGIDRGRYESFCFPVYHPELEDVLHALRSAQDQWTVRNAEIGDVPIGFVEAYRAGGDRTEYAARATALMRAFTEPVLAGALFPPGGGPGALDETYRAMAASIAAHADEHSMRSYAVAALLQRR